jgi:hypothetical protein
MKNKDSAEDLHKVFGTSGFQSKDIIQAANGFMQGITNDESKIKDEGKVVINFLNEQVKKRDNQ